MKLTSLGILIVALTLSCGKKSNNNGTSNSPTEQTSPLPSDHAGSPAPEEDAKVIPLAKDRPLCGSTEEGRLIYVLEKSIFQYCHESDWVDIDPKPSPANTSTVVQDESVMPTVLDVSGRKLGWYLNFNSTDNSLIVLLTNGLITKINPQTGSLSYRCERFGVFVFDA